MRQEAQREAEGRGQEMSGSDMSYDGYGPTEGDCEMTMLEETAQIMRHRDSEERKATADRIKATTPEPKGFWEGAEIISSYSRQQAIEDGVLIDVTEWGSDTKGFLGGFHETDVVMTAALWARVQAPRGSNQDTRGRAHDVLFMAILSIINEQRSMHRADIRTNFRVRLGRRYHLCVAVVDGEGVTLGFPADF